MRKKQAILNTISSLASYVILLIFGLVVQRFFKDYLGAEFLGVNGLFTNIMSGLAVVELGFGSAIIANMYKPVSQNDIPKIQALMNFYKKIYRYIAVLVFLSGICLVPFLTNLVGKTTEIVNIYMIYFLYLFDVVVSYFLTYKRSILYANQESYFITSIHTISLILTYIFQIFILFFYRNFYLYLVTSIVFRVLENIVINVIAEKKYPYLKQTNNADLDDATIKDIIRKVKGLFFHKIASFIVVGTDNIIISIIPGLGIVIVGVYSSYTLIISKLRTMVDNIFNSITASVGNLLVTNDKENSYIVFKNILFINKWIYIFFSVSFYFISFSFIELWMGKDFVLDSLTTLVIVFNLYLSGLRSSFGTFKNAAGIFYEDRYVPIVESIVNLVVSIPLAYIWGLKGVIIGTICSNFVLFLYSFPKYVYKLIFDKELVCYFKDFMGCIFDFIFIFAVTSMFMIFVPHHTVFIKFVVSTIICCVVPNIIYMLVKCRTKEFDYFKKIFTGILIKKG